MSGLRADEPSTWTPAGFLGAVYRPAMMPICINRLPSVACIPRETRGSRKQRLSGQRCSSAGTICHGYCASRSRNGYAERGITVFMPTARLCRHQPSKLLTPRIDAKSSVSPQIASGIILWSLRWHQSQETEDTNEATQFFARETDSRQPFGVPSSGIRNVAAGKRLSKEDHSGQVVLAHRSWVVVRAPQARDFAA